MKNIKCADVKFSSCIVTKRKFSINHDADYIGEVQKKCQSGLQSLDLDTRISIDSFHAALMSAGAGLTAVDAVLDEICDRLVFHANDQGGPDNITVVVFEIDAV